MRLIKSAEAGEVGLLQQIKQLAEKLVQQGLMVATAESCTGGWVAQELTAVAGSSAWFERGFVTYSNAAKQEMLAVSGDTLAKFGAVSGAGVREMALGALKYSRAQLAVAISGVAGPGGGSAEKPVGTVCFAWVGQSGEVTSDCLHFEGDRQAVRQQAVVVAIQGLLDLLDDGQD